jgi:hypothetical protein
MSAGARILRIAVRKFRPTESVCLHRSAIGLETESVFTRYAAPQLILTSPPYPGVHVLYHRWQIQGRRETPAPFWIANTLDGNGASFYTFGDRQRAELSTYFANAAAAFASIAKIAKPHTWLVQMVAFSEPDWQLERYLDVLSDAGFREKRFGISSACPDGRIWRSVPNRKWYADQQGTISASKEVVLFHQLART